MHRQFHPLFLPPPSSLCSHTRLLSFLQLLPNHQVLQQMVLGSTTTTAEYGGPSWSAHTHTHTMDSICLWMGRQLPIPPSRPDSYSWQREEGAPRVTKRSDKEEKGSHNRGKRTTNLQWQICFLVCFFPFLGPDGTEKETKLNPRPFPAFKQLTICVSAIKSRLAFLDAGLNSTPAVTRLNSHL